jgi:tyrosine-protein kinase Fer
VLLLGQKQALEELKQSVQQLRCTEAKCAAQKALLEQKVQENDGKEPPPVVNYEEDARSVTSMVSCGAVGRRSVWVISEHETNRGLL